MKKILLTAFEPFGGHSINASQEVARDIRFWSHEDAEIEVLELPVERFKALEIIRNALTRFQPDFVLMLGEASGRTTIALERVAINLDDFPIPDNAGNQPREESIVLGGPAAYFSTLPFLEIKKALEREGIPGSISNSAGTYLCNRLFYGVMHYLTEFRRVPNAGFIHVPLLPEQCLSDAVTKPSMARDMMVRAVKIAIETCLQTDS